MYKTRRVMYIDREGRRVMTHLGWTQSARSIVFNPAFQCWFKYDDGSREIPQPTRATLFVAKLWRNLSRYEKCPVRKLSDPSVIRNKSYLT